MATEKAGDFENAIPFKLKGATSTIGFSTTDRETHGFTVTEGGGVTSSTGTKVSANAGLTVKGVAASFTGSEESQNTVESKFSSAENYSEIVTIGKAFTYNFPPPPEGVTESWLLVPVYIINTWELQVAESDESGKFTKYAPRHKRLWPVPSTDGTSPEITDEDLATFEKGEASYMAEQYKKFKKGEDNTIDVAKDDATVEKIELASTKQNVPNVGKKKTLLPAFTPTEITSVQAISVVDGLAFSNSEAVTDTITKEMEGSVGLGSVLGISGSKATSLEIAEEVAKDTNSEIEIEQKIFQKFKVDAATRDGVRSRVDDDCKCRERLLTRLRPWIDAPILTPIRSHNPR